MRSRIYNHCPAPWLSRALAVCAVIVIAATEFAYAEEEGVDVGNGSTESTGEKPVTPFFRGTNSVLANLLDRKGALRVARINVQILVKSPEVNHKRLRELWPEISQEIGFILAGYHIEDIKNRESTEKLRVEIKTLVSNLFVKYFKDKESIEDLFFEELIAQ